MTGKTGTQKANISPVFNDFLQTLRADAGKQADALKTSGLRPWQVLDDVDLLNIAKLHQPAFDRDEINSVYQECMQNVAAPGTTGDVIALKQQVDYLATAERAFRLRHASLCRCVVHGAARRHGLAISSVLPAIERQVSNIIAKGGA